jgi:hypothetical protein
MPSEGVPVWLGKKQFYAVGIVAQGLLFPSRKQPEVFLPLEGDTRRVMSLGVDYNVSLVGEAKLGIARSDLVSYMDRIHSAALSASDHRSAAGRPVAIPLRDWMYADSQKVMAALLGGVLSLYCICLFLTIETQIAHLFATLGSFAVRVALGAQVKHLLALSGARMLPGLLVCSTLALVTQQMVFKPLAVFVLGDQIPPATSAWLGLLSVALLVGFSAMIGIVFSAPFLDSFKSDVSPLLTGRSNFEPNVPQKVYDFLLALQMALCSIFLFAAGMFGANAKQMINRHPGFESEGLLSIEVAASEIIYPNKPSLTKLYRGLYDNLHKLPTVSSVALFAPAPLKGVWSVQDVTVVIPGRSEPTILPEVEVVLASGDIRGALFGRLSQGLTIAPPGEAPEQTLLVSQQFEREALLPPEAVGNVTVRLALDPFPQGRRIAGRLPVFRQKGLDQAARPLALQPLEEEAPSVFAILLRTDQDSSRHIASSIRSTIEDSGVGLHITGLASYRDRVAELSRQEIAQSFIANLLSLCSLLVVLAGTAASVRRSLEAARGDWALRLALGAPVSGLRWRLTRHALHLWFIAMLLAAIPAFAIFRWLAPQGAIPHSGLWVYVLGASFFVLLSVTLSVWLSSAKLLELSPLELLHPQSRRSHYV